MRFTNHVVPTSHVVLILFLATLPTILCLVPTATKKLLLRYRSCDCHIHGQNDDHVELQQQYLNDDVTFLHDDAPPVSMIFPRYRIFLSRSSSMGNDDAASKGRAFLSSFFSALTRNQKSQLEQQYGAANVDWLEKKSGMQAFAALWRQAAALQQQQKQQQASNGSLDSFRIMALPDCHKNLVRNWIEILNWMKEQTILNENGANILDAVLLDDKEIPAVHIRVTDEVIKSQTLPGHHISASVISKQDDEHDKSSLVAISDDIVETRIKSWVNRILVNQGICPFTKSVSKSGQGLADVGVPVGRIAYHTSYATTDQIYQLMADTWEAISDMVTAGPSGKSGISSILLAVPGFDDDFALWAGPVFAMLEAGVVAIGAERTIGVVCFHPRYATPDGSSWPGFGHMHSVPRLQQWYKEHTGMTISPEDAAAGGAWQRRTPHATINVLRADQLAAAEARRATGVLYAENIQKLVGKPGGIGSDQLAQALNHERKLSITP